MEHNSWNIFYIVMNLHQKELFILIFFGGCIVPANRRTSIENALNAQKAALNINAEVKWTKITENYVDKYCELIHLFFDFVRSGDIRIRIMFRKTSDQYLRENMPQKDERYFKLYYQFLKHSFGFTTNKEITGDYYVHFYMDELPDHSIRANAFKDFLCGLPAIHDMEQSGLHIRKRDIGEVRSHDHVLLQCTDIILGAMYFKLNKLNEVIPEGKSRRGKKTIAKEKMYKFILKEIQTIHPHFNVGISTGFRDYENPHWESPYEHWCFKPNETL